VSWGALEHDGPHTNMVTTVKGASAPRASRRTVRIVLPASFRLGFEYEKKCTQYTRKNRAPEFKKFGAEIELDVGQLLATAPLRHYGAPYGLADAVTKEMFLWQGWFETRGPKERHPGRLRVNTMATTNSGRLVEFASSLGECVAMDLAIALFKIPLARWQRIPETGGEGMDFKAGAAIAIEAKARCSGGAPKGKITEQKSRQKAREKYAFVVCYERKDKKSLRRKGSYVRVLDPPGDTVLEEDPLREVLTHYYQISESIGIWRLMDLLGHELRLPASGHSDLDAARVGGARLLATVVDDAGLNLRRNARVFASNVVSVRGMYYVGRLFDSAELRAWGHLRDTPRPFFFMGISVEVLTMLTQYLLANGQEREQRGQQLLELVIGPSRGARFRYRFTKQGYLGPVDYYGLEDGLLRVDMYNLHQLTDEDLDTI
jgi:hypothetical protein